MAKYTKNEIADILKHTICPKGCGEVEIAKFGKNYIGCSVCGEEFGPGDELTNDHYSFLIKHLPISEEE